MTSKKPTVTEKVFRGSSIVLFFTFLGAPLGYLVRVLYSQSLSIEMFGLFYAALAFFSLLSTYLDFGLGFSASYFIPKFMKRGQEKNIAQIFQYTHFIEISVTILFSLILFFAASFLATNYFKSLEAVQLIYIFCLYLIANSLFTAINTLLIGFQDEAMYAGMTFFRLLLILIFSFTLWIVHTQNVLFYASTWAISTFLIVLIFYVVLFLKYRFVFQKPSWNVPLLSSLFKFGLPTLLTTSLFTFIGSTDSLFLTYFRDLKDVGVYNVVFPLATLSGLFLTPINALVLPLISHLMEGEEKKVSVVIANVYKVIPFISIYFGVFIALFSGPLISFLFGSKWTELATTPLALFSLGFIFSPLLNILVIILSGMGKANERLKLSFIVTILNILLCFFFIPRFGVMGAVVANTLIYAFSVLLFSFEIAKTFPLKIDYLFYLKLACFIAALSCVVSFLKISPTGFFEIITVGVIYTAFFVVFGLTQQLVDVQTKQRLFAIGLENTKKLFVLSKHIFRSIIK